ncbi:MAG: Uncharacterised protein [Polaribacter sejongensis]|nr:MAG: Uncharacterised protein [Polaribacter sejongensis]
MLESITTTAAFAAFATSVTTAAYCFALNVCKKSLETETTFSAPYVYNSEESVAFIVSATTLVPNFSATFFPYETTSKAVFLNFPSDESAKTKTDIIFRF